MYVFKILFINSLCELQSEHSITVHKDTETKLFTKQIHGSHYICNM